LYTVLSVFTGWPGFAHVGTLNLVSTALFVLACVAITWVALTAPRPPGLAALCFLVVAAFLLVNKVWSPQYSLWLVPLAALAIPRWKPVLAWMTIDALLWVPRMAYYLTPAHKGLPIEPFLGAVVIRDCAVVVLAALILHNSYRSPAAADPSRPGMKTHRVRTGPANRDMAPYRRVCGYVS
jgi:uncharacterized membrane protein